ncbi:serine hydrolase domain-containing protein [Gemmatimonas sp. UBA7669]|uniref:serine hydrolase domain-containing protein n=1 Tax=Gemmatimonas sp. UBA7669 TaxID=1946568 RepID=UPI0025B96C33|nr:serine hydrolase domain-containing protein [Gemmatimonas sp. UBA7669]
MPSIPAESQQSLPSPAPTDMGLAARVDSIARHFLRVEAVSGFTLGVLRGRDTIVLRGYGMADREANRAASPSTSYQLGSITKQFTAAAVLQLVEQKRLSIDDSVGAILPQYPTWRGITIRQLLNHTSGIVPFNTSPQWLPRRMESLPTDSVLGLVAALPLAFPSGTRSAYSNTGYLLLGRVVQERSGLTLDEYYRTHFFGPLGMLSGRYCGNTPVSVHDARGYTHSPAGFVEPELLDMGSFGGSGALCMSVPDFLRWQVALTSGRIVSSSWYWEMRGADTLSNGRTTRYGWGLIPSTIEGHDVVSHGGDTYGFGAEQLWFPDDSLRVVVFANTYGVGLSSQLAGDVARTVLGLSARPPAAEVEPSLRQALAGRYALQMPGGSTVHLDIWEGGARLMARLEGQQPFALSPRENGEFGSPIVPSLRIRVNVENGPGRSVELRQNGLTLRGAKVGASPPSAPDVQAHHRQQTPGLVSVELAN